MAATADTAGAAVLLGSMVSANRTVGIAAAVFSAACMCLSFVLISKIAFLGFAIGGWTGLRGYEQSIIDARQMAKGAIIRLAAAQVFGGALAFIALRRNLRMAWSLLFVAAFAGATFVLMWLYVESVTTFHQIWRTVH